MVTNENQIVFNREKHVTYINNNSGLTIFPSSSIDKNKIEIINIGNSETSLESKNNIREIHEDISKLINLKELRMQGIGLQIISQRIFYAPKLISLDISNNEIYLIPEIPKELTKIESINLSHNFISELPTSFSNLNNLRYLNLSHNNLEIFPEILCDLKDLETLDISHNKIVTLPEKISCFHKLKTLILSDNNFLSIGKDICKLPNLETLILYNLKSMELLPVVFSMTSLRVLRISGNITEIPLTIGSLLNLESFTCIHSKIISIPNEISNCKKLKSLYLSNNAISCIPDEIGSLINLTLIDLKNNSLKKLPLTIGNLPLTILKIDGNPLDPSITEIASQGISALLSYCRCRSRKSAKEWVSKLIIVGEGGVGKSSIARSLLGLPFQQNSETTHGMQILSMSMQHPNFIDTTMQLRCWDFGGQQIYHATHHFFLTNKSLFILVWDARIGYLQGRLFYWLDTIKARAPASPIIIVATKIDERHPDIPDKDLKMKYPQIVEILSVSNLENYKSTIETLKSTIALHAAALPLMGKEWPASWIQVANEIRNSSQKYISLSMLWNLMKQHGVEKIDMPVLATWLHELGDILCYYDDDELNDIVIIKPQWVAEYISRVFESKLVESSNGILTKDHMNELWNDIDAHVREHFLGLMERFDLSYKLDDDLEKSLVVDRVSLNPPIYEPTWEKAKEYYASEVSMQFELNTIPPGIPTWFIARSHRFTTHMHWRTGALFAYEPGCDKPHKENISNYALIKTDTQKPIISLSVRGSNPQNFFALLRDGLELTLRRYPGLEISRYIPCPGHDGVPCKYRFDYRHLESDLKDNTLTIRCPEGKKNVSIVSLLFGIHLSTQDLLERKLDTILSSIESVYDIVDNNLLELREFREIAQRNFLFNFNTIQEDELTHCPNVVSIIPKTKSQFDRLTFNQIIFIQLYCQCPGQWHKTGDDGKYAITLTPKWLVTFAPYLKRLMKVLKYAVPIVSTGIPITSVYQKDDLEQWKNEMNFMNELLKVAPSFSDNNQIGFDNNSENNPIALYGTALRELRSIIEKRDSQKRWGNLYKVLTPEGHYLWLCERHAQLFVHKRSI